METAEDFTTIESIFVRHRNALLLRGQFTPIYTDYYLHLMQHSVRPPGELDQMLKDTLAMLALHLVARPWAETIAWTVNLRAPRMNLFVTGSSFEQAVTGRIFTEDVREPDRNFFYAQTTTTENSKPRTSTLEIEGKDPIVSLTSYHAHTAAIADKYVDFLLVGDSLGNVMLGFDSTVPVTMDHMLHHTAAVRRGNSKSLLIADLPFGSYQASPAQALETAATFMKTGGAQAVKLEGGAPMLPQVEALASAGVPPGRAQACLVAAERAATVESGDATTNAELTHSAPSSSMN